MSSPEFKARCLREVMKILTAKVRRNFAKRMIIDVPCLQNTKMLDGMLKVQ